MNYEDQYVLGIMARDAASGRESFIENEYQRNEAAAFAAMAMDKENRPFQPLSTEDIAKGIYARVSKVLSSPENVFEVCVGNIGTENKHCNRSVEACNIVKRRVDYNGKFNRKKEKKPWWKF